MKKIGLITLNGYVNYGNRLQNYALQEVLKSYNYEVDTIWVIIKKNNPSDFTFKDKVYTTLNRSPKENYEKIIDKIKGKLIKNKLAKQREEIFREFSEQYIHETPYKVSEESIPKDMADEYNYFVTGSDQVWNPFFRKGDSTYFLTFAPKEKRIAYAPSFGTDKVPNDLIENYKSWISDMGSLSVREEAGAKIIKELTGRDAPVLVDPTLLLTKEQWLSIAKQPSNKPKEQFLLTYFLGDTFNDSKNRVKEIAKQNNLKIVNLAQPKDKVPYLSGPSEFIDYINSAELFLTDSFHGAVFATLLETPFIVFNRSGKFPSMNSRIDTLLNTFKLKDRHIDKIDSNEDIFDVDYSHVPNILEIERRKAFQYIEESLR